MLLVSLICACAAALAIVLWPEGTGVPDTGAVAVTPERDRRVGAVEGEGAAGAPPPAAPSAAEADRGRAADPLPGRAGAGPGPRAGSPMALPTGEPVGVVLGELVGPNVPLDVTWKLRLAPSRSLPGRELATSKTIEFAAGELSFRLDGLPLAGYDLSVEADGFYSRPQPVLLVPGAPQVVAMIEVLRAGFLSGQVIDENLDFVEALPIYLAPLPQGTRKSVRTAPDGTFRFSDLAEGEYRLFVGSPERPLLEPLEVSFRPPSLRLEPFRVPRLAGLVVRVVDERGAPVAGARVRGLGDRGGQVDVVTDAFGEARTALLVAGTYRLRAHHPDFGDGFLLQEVDLESFPPEVEIRLTQ